MSLFQEIEDEEVDDPEDLENLHRELVDDKDYKLAGGGLGFYLGGYDQEFTRPDEDSELKAEYYINKINGRPWIEKEIEYVGDLDELETFYKTVIQARTLDE